MEDNDGGVSLGQDQVFLGSRPEEYQKTVALEGEIIYDSYQEMCNSLPGDVCDVWNKFESKSKQIRKLCFKSEVEKCLNEFIKGIESKEIDLAFKIYKHKGTDRKIEKYSCMFGIINALKGVLPEKCFLDYLSLSDEVLKNLFKDNINLSYMPHILFTDRIVRLYTENFIGDTEHLKYLDVHQLIRLATCEKYKSKDLAKRLFIEKIKKYGGFCGFNKQELDSIFQLGLHKEIEIDKSWYALDSQEGVLSHFIHNYLTNQKYSDLAENCFRELNNAEALVATKLRQEDVDALLKMDEKLIGMFFTPRQVYYLNGKVLSDSFNKILAKLGDQQKKKVVGDVFTNTENITFLLVHFDFNALNIIYKNNQSYKKDLLNELVIKTGIKSYLNPQVIEEFANSIKDKDNALFYKLTEEENKVSKDFLANLNYYDIKAIKDYGKLESLLLAKVDDSSDCVALSCLNGATLIFVLRNYFSSDNKKLALNLSKEEKLSLISKLTKKQVDSLCGNFGEQVLKEFAEIDPENLSSRTVASDNGSKVKKLLNDIQNCFASEQLKELNKNNPYLVAKMEEVLDNFVQIELYKGESFFDNLKKLREDQITVLSEKSLECIKNNCSLLQLIELHNCNFDLFFAMEQGLEGFSFVAICDDYFKDKNKDLNGLPEEVLGDVVEDYICDPKANKEIVSRLISDLTSETINKLGRTILEKIREELDAETLNKNKALKNKCDELSKSQLNSSNEENTGLEEYYDHFYN